MSDIAVPREAAAASPAPLVSPREALPWAVFAGVVLTFLLVVVGAEGGATSVFGSGSTIHELVHDGRHLLGFPCH